ncbi:MAG: HK97 family phage prohead protease [Oscillospiraceae bacterium]|nr:HK97 family phage prohead protease [Oscillospiraceae bacterium]
MKIEERADGLHINGYVNVTGKISRPLITPHGQCVETIEERAFQNAIEKSGNISVTVDHDSTHVYAETRDGTLQLEEDAIGLKATVLIKDKEIIEAARKGKIRGWSFGMYNVIDEMEQRAEGQLPLRHVKEFLLDHVTLVINKMPCYAATSVECRADDEVSIESRAFDTGVEIEMQKQKEKIDYSEYVNRIKNLEKR